MNHAPVCTPYRPAWESLDDLAAIRNAEAAPPQYWICRQPPTEVLGALLEEFSGVYLGHDDAAHVCLQHRQARHPLPASVRHWPASRLNALLGVILQMELDGQSDGFIAGAIQDFTQPQPHPIQEAA
jgi:hypothetical protein